MRATNLQFYDSSSADDWIPFFPLKANVRNIGFDQE